MKVSRRGAVPPFLIMEVFGEASALARQGSDMIHLSLGQPGCELPPRVLKRVAELMQTAKLGYTEAAGLPALRERIARHYHESYGVTIAPERIFITLGSSAAFILSLIAAFDANDTVAIARPCYPAYPSMMTGLDLVPAFLRGTAENRFQPTIEALDALPHPPQGLVIASPSNPASTVLRPQELQALAAYAQDKNIRIISDEIYHHITYGTQAHSITEYSNSAIVVNSFSKYFLMPGWRLGWAVVPEDLVRSFESLVQNFFISPSAIAQYAALEVFDCREELAAEVALYSRNRQILMQELPQAGFTGFAPCEGSFFIYADVSHMTDDSVAFCRRMMHETGVVAVPGVDFDRENGHHFVRFSFSNTEAQICEAMRRLKQWQGGRKAA